MLYMVYVLPYIFRPALDRPRAITNLQRPASRNTKGGRLQLCGHNIRDHDKINSVFLHEYSPRRYEHNILLIKYTQIKRVLSL